MPRPPRRSWCTRTSRARWPTAAWGRRCGHRPSSRGGGGGAGGGGARGGAGPGAGAAARLSGPSSHFRGHQEKIRQRQSVLPPAQGPAPIPFQRYGRDSPSTKNRVDLPMPLRDPGGPRRMGWGRQQGWGGGAQSAAALLPNRLSHLGVAGAGRGTEGRAGSEDREGDGGSRAGRTSHPLRAPGANPQPAPTPSPRPGAKRQRVGVSLQRVGLRRLTPAPALTPANPQLRPG